MKTLTGSPAARVSTAQFPVDNVDQQTALSIQPAAQAALSGVARAYSELDGHNGRIAAIELNVAGAGAIDGRLDALELLTGSTGGIDARLDSVEAGVAALVGSGIARAFGTRFTATVNVTPLAQTTAIVSIPLGFAPGIADYVIFKQIDVDLMVNATVYVGGHRIDGTNLLVQVVNSGSGSNPCTLRVVGIVIRTT